MRAIAHTLAEIGKAGTTTSISGGTLNRAC